MSIDKPCHRSEMAWGIHELLKVLNTLLFEPIIISRMEVQTWFSMTVTPIGVNFTAFWSPLFRPFPFFF
jgi:hypothetical protein